MVCERALPSITEGRRAIIEGKSPRPVSKAFFMRSVLVAISLKYVSCFCPWSKVIISPLCPLSCSAITGNTEARSSGFTSAPLPKNLSTTSCISTPDFLRESCSIKPVSAAAIGPLASSALEAIIDALVPPKEILARFSCFRCRSSPSGPEKFFLVYSPH